MLMDMRKQVNEYSQTKIICLSNHSNVCKYLVSHWIFQASVLINHVKTKTIYLNVSSLQGYNQGYIRSVQVKVTILAKVQSRLQSLYIVIL